MAKKKSKSKTFGERIEPELENYAPDYCCPNVHGGMHVPGRGSALLGVQKYHGRYIAIYECFVCFQRYWYHVSTQVDPTSTFMVDSLRRDYEEAKSLEEKVISEKTKEQKREEVEKYQEHLIRGNLSFKKEDKVIYRRDFHRLDKDLAAIVQGCLGNKYDESSNYHRLFSDDNITICRVGYTPFYKIKIVRTENFLDVPGRDLIPADGSLVKSVNKKYFNELAKEKSE